MEKCSIIYNPISTGFNSSILENIKKKFQAKGIKAKLIKSRFAGHVPEIIKEENENADLIITLGGDGTIGEAIRGFQECKQSALYSHISTGTANDVRNNFGLDSNPNKATDLILEGEEQTMDIVTVNDVAFGYVSCFGALTNIPYETKFALKKHLGKNGYIISAIPEILKLLTGSIHTYNITYDKNGEEITGECLLAAISNSKGFGGIDVYPNANIDDGNFEVLIIKKISSELIGALLHDYLNNNFDLNNYQNHLDFFTTDNLTITFNEQVPEKPIDNDGDMASVSLDDNNRTLNYKTNGKVKMLLPKKKTYKN